MPVLLALITVASTLAGGLFALRFRHLVRPILGLTGGVVLGVVCFDLFPELFDLTHSTGTSVRLVMVAVLAAFLGFHILEKSVLAHHGGEAEGDGHHHPHVGLNRAGPHGRRSHPHVRHHRPHALMRATPDRGAAGTA